MSTERGEGYSEALEAVRSTIRRRLGKADVSEDGKLELLDLLSMLDDMLKSGQPDDMDGSSAPVPMSGSF